MMKALSKDLSVDVATVEGLDTFFERAEAVTGQGETVSDPVNGQIDSVLYWTLQEAADNLGVSTRTILRRLKTRVIQGHKIAGGSGPEWRIVPTDENEQTVIRQSGPVMPGVKPCPDRTLDEALSKYAEHLLQLVEEKNVRLLQLSMQNGYLQGQLDTTQEKIRLLEDRAQRPWWRGVWSWLWGQERT
jgi:hypothetical protein